MKKQTPDPAMEEREAIVAFLDKCASDDNYCQHKPNREAAGLFRVYIQRGEHRKDGE